MEREREKKSPTHTAVVLMYLPIPCLKTRGPVSTLDSRFFRFAASSSARSLSFSSSRSLAS